MDDTGDASWYVAAAEMVPAVIEAKAAGTSSAVLPETFFLTDCWLCVRQLSATATAATAAVCVAEAVETTDIV